MHARPRNNRLSSILLSLTSMLGASCGETPVRPDPAPPVLIEAPRPRLPRIPAQVMDRTREEDFLQKQKDFWSQKPTAPTQ